MTDEEKIFGSEQPIIDIHAHVFPPKIVKRAVESIGRFYDLTMQQEGDLDTLLKDSRKAGIVRSVIFSTATTREQVESIQNFIAGLKNAYPDRLIGFGTLHPDMTPDEIRAEVDYIVKEGLSGIKLHPDFQRCPVDSPAVFAMAAAAEGRIPILTHAGDYRYSFSHPEQIRRLAEAFPGLTLIAAHFGGWSEWYKSADILAGLPNVYVDTSSSLDFLSVDHARSLVRAFGADHVLFGTDYPMWGPQDELRRLRTLGLREEELRMILYDNAAALLRLSSSVSSAR